MWTQAGCDITADYINMQTHNIPAKTPFILWFVCTNATSSRQIKYCITLSDYIN